MEQTTSLTSTKDQAEAVADLAAAVALAEEPDSKNVSLQMKWEDFDEMELMRVALRVDNRSAFIQDAIAYYVEVFGRTGAVPGSLAARSRGDQITDLLAILGLRGSHWRVLKEELQSSGTLTPDSYWLLVLDRISIILGD